MSYNSLIFYRCNDAVIRIEQSALGTVFVCRYGGSKHAVNGCRRTYLSQRDLQVQTGNTSLCQMTFTVFKDHAALLYVCPGFHGTGNFAVHF